MDGMFTVFKVRNDIQPGDYSDPGWYRQSKGTDPDFGTPHRKPT